MQIVCVMILQGITQAVRVQRAGFEIQLEAARVGGEKPGRSSWGTGSRTAVRVANEWESGKERNLQGIQVLG